MNEAREQRWLGLRSDGGRSAGAPASLLCWAMVAQIARSSSGYCIAAGSSWSPATSGQPRPCPPTLAAARAALQARQQVLVGVRRLDRCPLTICDLAASGGGSGAGGSAPAAAATHPRRAPWQPCSGVRRHGPPCAFTASQPEWALLSVRPRAAAAVSPPMLPLGFPPQSRPAFPLPPTPAHMPLPRSPHHSGGLCVCPEPALSRHGAGC